MAERALADLCDLCDKVIEPLQGRLGGNGDGGRSGSRPGRSRHWNCHVARYGKPGTDLGALRERVRTPTTPRRRILKPRVLKGPDNRSENARREWRSFSVISEMGKRRIEVECPFCFATFWAYVWSLSGGGKRCPNCRAMHTSHGSAYPLEGNEDLGAPD